MPPVALLWASVIDQWGWPALVVGDMFRKRELEDSIEGAPLETRRALWSQSSEDIRATRRLTKDGPLSLAPSARALLMTSLTAAGVASDTSGNQRMIKKGHANESRDDIAVALTLACGAWDRSPPGTVVEVNRACSDWMSGRRYCETCGGLMVLDYFLDDRRCVSCGRAETPPRLATEIPRYSKDRGYPASATHPSPLHGPMPATAAGRTQGSPAAVAGKVYTNYAHQERYG